MRAKKPLFVQYCAADFLAGTVTLSPYAELAYRRICDMIYNTGDELLDDDARMPIATKTGKRWPRVKAELLAEGKIQIVNNKHLRVERCSKEVSRAQGLVEQRRMASKLGVERRKLLKEQETGQASGSPSDTPSGQPSGHPSGHRAVNLTVNHKEEEGRKERVSTTPRAEAAHSPAIPSEKLRPDFLDRSDPDNLTEVGNRVLVLAGVQPETWQHDFHVIASWLRTGCNPETDIYPTVKRLVDDNPNFTPPRSARGLAYFTEAVVEAKGRRLAGPNGSDPDFDPERSRWEGRCSGFAKRNFWIDDWGPKPGQPGCQAPLEIVEKYGP